MIYINFVPGSHGNYLEFICNTIIYDCKANNSPFNRFGASHHKEYKSEQKVKSRHYYQNDNTSFDGNIISIRYELNDLLPLTMISIERAGDIDVSNIEVDTYNKLNNTFYQLLLNNLIENYNNDLDFSEYRIIKDVSWPDVTSIADFENLPEHIRKECIEVHKYHPINISPENPDCPRFIIRDLYKQGFKNPEQSGFALELNKIKYDKSDKVHYINYKSFYSLTDFLLEIEAITKFLNVTLSNDQINEITELHLEFLKRQPYAQTFETSQAICKRIFNNEVFNLPEISVFEEAFINAQIELHYNINLPFMQYNWFSNSSEIYSLLNLDKN